MSIWGLFSLTAITVNATNSNVSNGLFGGYSGSAGSVTITNGVLDAVVIDGAAGNAAVRGDFTAGGATPTLMVTSNAVTVENGTNVHMGGNQVHGVANGLAAYDAVNVQQLHNLERMLSGGIAASTAVSNIPPVESGQTFSFGVGLGHYNDRSALALGCAYRFSPTGQVRASACERPGRRCQDSGRYRRRLVVPGYVPAGAGGAACSR